MCFQQDSPEQHWTGRDLWALLTRPCQALTIPIQNPPLWFPCCLRNDLLQKQKSHAVHSWTWRQYLGPGLSQAQVWHLGPAGSFHGPIPYLIQACNPSPASTQPGGLRTLACRTPGYLLLIESSVKFLSAPGHLSFSPWPRHTCLPSLTRLSAWDTITRLSFKMQL